MKVDLNVKCCMAGRHARAACPFHGPAIDISHEPASRGFLMQVVPTLEARNPAIRTWRQTEEGGPASLPTSVIYMDLPVRASPCRYAHPFAQLLACV